MLKQKKLRNFVIRNFVIMLLVMFTALLLINSQSASSQIETGNYRISPDSIRINIISKELVEEKIVIENLMDKTIALSFSIDGNISPMVEADKEETSIEAKSSDEIILRFMGNSKFSNENITQESFNGEFVISGDISEKVSLNLTLFEKRPKSILMLLMELESIKTSVDLGSDFQFNLNLNNLLPDSSYDIALVYLVDRLGNDSSRNNSLQQSQNITMKDSLTLFKKIRIPDDFEVGDYTLEVEATYLNFTSKASTIFSVRRPFQKYTFFGVIPVWTIFVVLIILVVIFLIYSRIKKSREKKKRFHAKVDEKSVPAKGDRSLWVGMIAESKQRAYLDMDILTVHTIFAGSTGAGKTTGAQVIIEEALMKDVSVVIFDPTAQWSGMLRKSQDAKMMSFYSKFGMKPGDARTFNGNVRLIKNSKEIIDVNKYLKPGEVHIFALNQLDAKGLDLFIANSIKQVFRAGPHEVRQLKTLFVFDEIHMILPKFGGTGMGFLQIERACREFRKWGIGVILISQVLADFMGQIKANINTEFLLRTRDESDLNRIKMKYGQEFIQSLVKAPTGAGMLQNAAWNKGLPYYIEIRPILHETRRISDDELAKYNQYNEMVDDLEYQIEQLEEMKLDVFDLRLELKLAKDKIKTGNFNIVQIYLDGLIPRMQKMWDKLGKKPKKLEMKLADDAEIASDLEKAKEAFAKYEAEAKAAAASGGAA